MDHVVTSTAWSPDGTVFAVGMYDALRLCDRAGWTHHRAKCESGSLYALAWTADGTQLAGAGANESLVVASVRSHYDEHPTHSKHLPTTTHAFTHARRKKNAETPLHAIVSLQSTSFLFLLPICASTI